VVGVQYGLLDGGNTKLKAKVNKSAQSILIINNNIVGVKDGAHILNNWGRYNLLMALMEIL
jgi:hypothetical protein